MKIGIVIHSQSGTTAKVAKALDASLTEKGHDVDIQLLRTTGKVAPRSKAFELKNIPDPQEYGCIILGAPVWAFTISPVIMKYIAQLGRLTGKKVLCFVTKALPFQWTGGTQAIKAMEAELALSDADMLPGVILGGATVRNEARLKETVESIASRVA